MPTLPSQETAKPGGLGQSSRFKVITLTAPGQEEGQELGWPESRCGWNCQLPSNFLSQGDGSTTGLSFGQHRFLQRLLSHCHFPSLK